MNKGKYYSILAPVFLVAFALLLLMKWRVIVEYVTLNQWGIQVVKSCFSQDAEKDKTSLEKLSEGILNSWLTAQLSHCLGHEQEAAGGWLAVLADAPDRMDLVRAIRPFDMTLAQYATSLYPGNAQAFFWLGDAYQEGGQNIEALQAYETGLTWQPEQDANAWMSVGRLHEEEGSWEQAEHAYNQACYYVDQGKNGCPNAGRLYLAREQYELAAQRYRDSMKQLPDWQPARLGLAQALLGLGQTDEARAHLTFLANEGNRAAQDLLNQLSENQTQP